MYEDLYQECVYIGLLESSVNKLDTLIEIFGEVEPLMVLSRNVLIQRDLGFWMAEAGSTCSSEDCFD